MKQIILDTNFLLIPSKFRVDIFEEIHRLCSFKYSLCIIDRTLDELRSITKPLKEKMHAKLAMKLINAYKINILKTEKDGDVDSLILQTVNKQDFIVATQDKFLKKKLKSGGIPVITLRQKQYLIVV